MVPSGEQHEIVCGEACATVVEVGGAVRTFDIGGVEVLDPFPIDKICDGAHGTVLVPWPNRLADGRYSFDGHDYQVALTEPEKHNAIHGFLRWRNFALRESEPSRVVVASKLNPLAGYPFALLVEVAYELTHDELVVATTATNTGDRPLPYGTGQHPYLSPGAGHLLDECTLELRAKTRIVTDDERQLPIGTEPTANSAFDFNTPRPIGSQAIDFAFTDLERDGDGRAWLRLGRPDGRTVELWVDAHYPLLEVYTGDTLAPHRRRHGLGAEPMTCPPNAFQSGMGVIRLEPEEQFTSRWGVRLAS